MQGSSAGAREFVEKALPEWKKRFPQIPVEVVVSFPSGPDFETVIATCHCNSMFLCGEQLAHARLFKCGLQL